MSAAEILKNGYREKLEAGITHGYKTVEAVTP